MRSLVPSRPAVAAAVLALGCALVASPAQAVTVGTCSGSGTVTISPGLRLTTPVLAKLTLTGKLTGCTGNLPRTATLKGSATATAPGITCRSGAATGKVTVTWGNGTVDVLNVKADTTNGISGTVVSGPRKGAKIALAGDLKPVTGDCVFSPLTKASFSGTATVTR